jgi:hypothetical protein
MRNGKKEADNTHTWEVIGRLLPIQVGFGFQGIGEEDLAEIGGYMVIGEEDNFYLNIICYQSPAMMAGLWRIGLLFPF